jgi:EmrB/QacA subfamily drug resistance transporter
MTDETERPQHKWWTLGVVCVAVFMLLLDITIVNIALPDIQRDLHSSFSDLQWVVDAYALMLASVLLTSGSLADLLGRRRIFIAGVVIFTVASVGCGLSTTPLMLNLMRGVQGIGGAMMFATSLAIIAQAFPPRELGTAFGVYGATIGGATAIGPLAGGALTQGLGWEWIFFVNVPIGVFAVFGALTRVAESRDERGARIDFPGLITWSGGLFLLIFALVRGNAEGWGSTLILSLFAGSAVLLVAFVLIERASTHPMLDLELFRNPSFSGAAIVGWSLSAGMFAMFLYLTLYVQNVLGYSPLAAGVRFLPITVLSFFVAPVAGRLTNSVPVRMLLGTGMALTGFGLVLMIGLHAGTSWTHLLPGFFLTGAGIGMVNPPLAETQIGVVDPRRSGMASGIGNTFRQVGIATGIAGLGAIFSHAVRVKTLAALGKLHLGLAGIPGAALDTGQVHAIAAHAPPAHRAAYLTALQTGFTDAFNELLIIGAIVCLAGALAGYAMIRRRDFVAHQAPGEAPAPAAA